MDSREQATLPGRQPFCFTMIQRRRLRFLLSALLLLGVWSSAPALCTAEEARVDFDREIRPILANTCYTCHGPDEEARQAELRLHEEEGAKEWVIVPGEPDESELIRRITSEYDEERMPPTDAVQQLGPEQIELLTRWIAEGAEWTRHWSFVAPKRPALPEVKQTNWPINEIDHFVLARLEQEGLTPSPLATKEALLRRVSFDLTGMPPTLAEVEAFLADESPDAYEKVVDRLLASQRYGEHMALKWLAAARYADSNGYQNDATRSMWPWRDWVIRALNANLPFDKFTLYQLAGDLLESPTQDQIIATGFNRNHMLNGEGGRIEEESRVEYVMDRVETTSTVWMGLTIGCCRCHDHKYDPLPQQDFYRMYAFFNNVDETGGVELDGNAKPILLLPTEEEKAQVDDLEAKIAIVEEQIDDLPQATPEELSAWEAETSEWLAKAERDELWQPLADQEVSSSVDSKMEVLDDQSVLVADSLDEHDDYTVEATLLDGTYHGIRLEGLKHERLFKGLFSSGSSGDFFPTSIVVEVDGQPVKLIDPQSTVGSPSSPQNLLDDNKETGWKVGRPKETEVTPAWVARFRRPVVANGQTRITVRILHEATDYGIPMGRFRLSLSSYPRPTVKDQLGLSQDVVQALATEPEQRTPKDESRLLEAVRETCKWPLWDTIGDYREEITKLEKTFLRTMTMSDREVPRTTYLLNRGVWNNPDKSEELHPSVPGCLPELPEGAPENRLALAEWLVDPNNPLMARVTVNRYWQDFFGIGLVKTSEDFGTQGERPSHPELLDWLATEFILSGWDVKAMHKLIVMSATYRQASDVSEELVAMDPENRLLARGPRFRLSSQALRDQALATSGLLVERVGGPPVMPYQPEGVWEDFTLGKISYDQGQGEDLYRRSIYTFWRRSVGPTMFFDNPGRQVCTVRPSLTNSPLHALTMLNDVTYVEAARVLAEKTIKAGDKSPVERIAHVFRQATCRHASQRELAELLSAYDDFLETFQADPEAARELVSVGEWPRDESVDIVELAAYTSLINAILNLDEVITKS